MLIRAVDLFCGGGGTTRGLERACRKLGVRFDLTAINHNEEAIATHILNHPFAKSHRLSLDGLNPRTLIPGTIHFLCGSPECTHHSRAAGGQPKNDQSRATAWIMLSWMQSHLPLAVLIENVPEFVDWGPLDENRKPIPSRKGETFQAYIQMMRALGYSVEWQVLNAANYGEATSRKRLFIIAALGNRPIRFPAPTHRKPGNQMDLFTAGLPEWRTAREILDPSLRGKSVLNRKKPLAMPTLRRMTVGIQKYWGLPVDLLKPETFEVQLDSDEPLERLLSDPFLIKFYGTSNCKPLTEPVGTITAGGGKFGIVEPFLLYYNQKTVSGLHEPVATITTKHQYALVRPFPVMPGTQNAITLTTPSGRYGIDLAHRMLSGKELGLAMGFDADYRFVGKQKDVIRLIGNAVPVHLAEAVTATVLKDHVLPFVDELAA
jgi:DNA (cytosine-5)-methyltransferase 1